MCGLNLEIISTASLVVMKLSKKRWQIALNKCIVKFKKLHFKSVTQC